MERNDIIRYLTSKDSILKKHHERIMGFHEYLDNEDSVINAVVFSDLSLSETYVKTSHDNDPMTLILKRKEKLKADIEKEYLDEVFSFEKDQMLIDRIFTSLEILDEDFYDVVKDSVVNGLPFKVIENKYGITKPTAIKRRDRGLDKIIELVESDYTLAELKIMSVENVGRRKAFENKISARID